MSFLFKNRGPNRQERQSNEQFQRDILGLAREAGDRSEQQFNLALPYFEEAGSRLGEAGDYFSRVLADPFSALGPELAEAETAYRNVSSRGSFAPRGGGQISRQTQLDTQHLKNLSNIISQGRTSAASSLSGISGLYAGLGSSLSGQSAGNLGAMGQFLSTAQSNNLALQQARMARQNARWDELGEAAGTLLALFA